MSAVEKNESKLSRSVSSECCYFIQDGQRSHSEKVTSEQKNARNRIQALQIAEGERVPG